MSTDGIRYIYSFANGRREVFDLTFDPKTLTLVHDPGEPLPEWTEMKQFRCDNCPLDPEQVTHCPLAVALVEPVTRFGDVISYQEMRVDVITPERAIVQKCSAQDGISSLLGLINATSGCPHTAFFRPMARFHLPFASEAETIYRAVSMYLLGEYFRSHSGTEPDVSLTGLIDIYREIETVNRSIVQRLRSIRTEDSALNAIVLLDLYAKSLPFAVEDALEDLRYLFSAYERKK